MVAGRTSDLTDGYIGSVAPLDAIPPWTLWQMTEPCITRHIDQDVYRGTMQAEKLERSLIRDIARRPAEELEDEDEDE